CLCEFGCLSDGAMEADVSWFSPQRATHRGEPQRVHWRRRGSGFDRAAERHPGRRLWRARAAPRLLGEPQASVEWELPCLQPGSWRNLEPCGPHDFRDSHHSLYGGRRIATGQQHFCCLRFWLDQRTWPLHVRPAGEYFRGATCTFTLSPCGHPAHLSRPIAMFERDPKPRPKKLKKSFKTR